MSFQQLQDIIDENKGGRESLEDQPLVSCPIDGELLDEGRNGVLHCPLGNYTSA